MIDWTIILQAGIASGTVLLFAALGEILAERSGVLNLGLEGMMLLGAMFAFKTAVATGNPWLGLLVAALAAGVLGAAARDRDRQLPGRPGGQRPGDQLRRASGSAWCWARG